MAVTVSSLAGHAGPMLNLGSPPEGFNGGESSCRFERLYGLRSSKSICDALANIALSFALFASSDWILWVCPGYHHRWIVVVPQAVILNLFQDPFCRAD
ncbi:hypothetical protein [Novosphingobium sp. ZW T3_23]|uniref:hypothetical protein n=1 Tax=Novosphingobium sp. ZW T3_23 TaxID=3378084 RepID=UPI00385297DC